MMGRGLSGAGCNSLSQLFDTSGRVASDLDKAEKGFMVFNATSVNAPSTYGIVLTFGQYGNSSNTNWIFQIAVGTSDSNLYMRRNINFTGWTDWNAL